MMPPTRRPAKRRRLATRMVLLGIAMLVILQTASICIWYFAMPHHPAPPGVIHHRVLGLPLGLVLATITGFFVLGIGSLLIARWLVSPIQKLSETAKAIGGGDLGARSHIQRDDEIGVLGKQLDEMARRLELLVASERELLANVAHELRTPLSRIGVALDLAAEGDGKRARASLEDIAVDVAELERIVDDILTAMRLDSSHAAELRLRRACVAPSEIAASAAERQRTRHPERALEVAVSDELPAIDVDPMLFRRIVDNLLENAHKYTPDPSAPIELRVNRSGADIAFEVADKGIGIPPEDLPRVFTAFYRGDRSRSRETGGVGLGLTLARRIAVAHGGAISLESELGRGTTVRLTVPAATAQPVTPRSAA